MGTLLYVFIALIILLLMVTIHEFGHYIAGKILKFKINEFSIGFGPSIISRKCKNGETFSIRWIPLGGYCAFEGEDENSNDEQSFDKQAPWKRIIVLIAGGLFNIISAVFFSIILLVSVGVIVGFDAARIQSTNIAVATNIYNIESTDLIYSITDSENKIIVCSDKKIESNKNYFIETDNNSYLIAAYLPQFIYENTQISETNNYLYDIKKLSKVTSNDQQGDFYDFDGEMYYKDLKNDKIALERIVNYDLKANDVIYKINGTRLGFTTKRQLKTLMSEVDSSRILLTVKRAGKMQEITTTGHTYSIINGENTVENTSLGISLSAYKYGFFEALGRAIPFTFEICVAVIEILGQLFTNVQTLSTVGGPITTIATIAGVSQKSFGAMLFLLPLIAANLGVFNLMPIPALDGSKVIFCLIEWIRKKPLNKNIENQIHTIGFFILMGLVVVADLYQVFFAKIFKTLFG